ncbi:iron complex transport system substrate-binding protein [Saonia flava]|uniref:Iron complex transport system substrate-binding protein n=1 Tax=Saonia flava TaxID=523696 RepID=A0A846QYL5_9FLAO|nr:ABC transporter substrate-binding protein [Saonia flava]NJB72010.1 iron complex transport system substrate-binding protein [Saonia flava]
MEKSDTGITTIKVTSPWPNANKSFVYALVPKEKLSIVTLNKDEYDAIVAVPVERIVSTSTTHIPALESLGVLDNLIGFPDTQYISSNAARKRIDGGQIQELGNNEQLNTEMLIAIQPDVVFGFGIDNQNTTYETIQQANIPVVYNGDWTEETPLGKAEWIKFFAPFFQLEKKADSIFNEIESSYKEAKILAKKANVKPSILSGAMYKDVWYLPGGNSWAAKFLEDANGNYLWSDKEETGSLSLSIESVLEIAQQANFWIAPSQYTSYQAMLKGNQHYAQFDAFKNKKVYTFSSTVGETGGILYYELAPNRPDLVLKDLIHILHPELLPNHQLFFFTPLN